MIQAVGFLFKSPGNMSIEKAQAILDNKDLFIYFEFNSKEYL